MKTLESFKVRRDFLTEDELRRYEQCVEAATLGPWYVPVRDSNDEAHIVMARDPATAQAVTVAHTRWPLTILSPDIGKAARNATFIAQSREIAPRLLAEVRHLQRENKLLKSVATHARAYLSESAPGESLLAMNLTDALNEWDDRFNDCSAAS